MNDMNYRISPDTHSMGFKISEWARHDTEHASIHQLHVTNRYTMQSATVILVASDDGRDALMTPGGHILDPNAMELDPIALAVVQFVAENA